MRAILADFRRVLRGGWMYAAILITAACLWLDLGTDSYWLLRGGAMDPMEMLAKALSGRGGALSLPLLAALPCAASALQELSAGAARMAVFRCGRAAYIAGKLLTVLVMAALSQAAGCLLFLGVLLALSPASSAAFPAPVLLARLMSAMIFACVGGVGALLSGDTVSAYAVPTALSFALTMLAARFFTGVRYLSPLSWLSGEGSAVPVLWVLLSAASVLYAVILRREVLRHA